MSEYKWRVHHVGVGEYKTRAGGRAWIGHIVPAPTDEPLPLSGYYWDGTRFSRLNWDKDGRLIGTWDDPGDLIEPIGWKGEQEESPQMDTLKRRIEALERRINTVEGLLNSLIPRRLDP